MAASDRKETIELTPTSLPHVFLCDIDDSGLLKEILVVKKFKDGSIYYVEIDTLHPIDKGRIKKIVSSQHADKYDCWELLSQARLSNGMNALDFFHTNNVKVKRPRGARAVTGSLESAAIYGTDKMIGSDFVNPMEATLDPASKTFAPVEHKGGTAK
jgi:hypothetical protein